MAAIKLVETSLRDGNQSLWARTGLNTAMMLTIRPDHGARRLQGHRLHHLHPHGRGHPLQAGGPVAAYPPDGGGDPEHAPAVPLHGLSLHRLGDRERGVHGPGVQDSGQQRHPPFRPGRSDPTMWRATWPRPAWPRPAGRTTRSARWSTALSPIHDDAHYVECARQMAACPDIDALYIKDPGGLLDPVRARTLVPKIRAVIGEQAAGIARPLHHRPGGPAVRRCADPGRRTRCNAPRARRRTAPPIRRRGGWRPT